MKELARKLSENAYQQAGQADARFWAEAAAKAARVVAWTIDPPRAPVLLSTAAKEATELREICEVVVLRKAWLSHEGHAWWEMQGRTLGRLAKAWKSQSRQPRKA